MISVWSVVCFCGSLASQPVFHGRKLHTKALYILSSRYEPNYISTLTCGICESLRTQNQVHTGTSLSITSQPLSSIVCSQEYRHRSASRYWYNLAPPLIFAFGWLGDYFGDKWFSCTVEFRCCWQYPLTSSYVVMWC